MAHTTDAPVKAAVRPAAARKAQKQAMPRVKRGSVLECAFDTQWRRLAPPFLPAPVAEHQPCPPRRWRIDRSWPDLRVAIELEGGVFNGGRHTRGTGFESDVEKYNALAAEGWLLLRFTSRMLRTDPAGCIALVCDVVEQRQQQQAWHHAACAALGMEES